MKNERLPFKKTDFDYVAKEARKHLSEKALPLWDHLVSENKERGISGADSYLRDWFRELEGSIEGELQGVREGIEKEIGG